MTAAPFDPELDLSIDRLIRAPRTTAWRTWTEAALLERWWMRRS